MAFENLQVLLADIEKLQQAHGILEKIWLDINSYTGQGIKPETLSLLRDYFGFDDSE